MKGVSGHQRCYEGETDDWLTPPELIEKLGPFDLDPCCPPTMPWRTARLMLTAANDGLSLEWEALWLPEEQERKMVWLNPPYGQATGVWLMKLHMSGLNGLALTFARTDTEMFHSAVFGAADAVYFLKGRLFFYRPDGSKATHNAGGPSCLIAYGKSAVERLRSLRGFPGELVILKEKQL